MTPDERIAELEELVARRERLLRGLLGVLSAHACGVHIPRDWSKGLVDKIRDELAPRRGMAPSRHE
jgi:uncharacterized coiled-coil protein SlyX